MTTVAEALKELGITEWTLKGNPTNEDEFNANFKKVIDSDSNGTAIKSDDPSKFGVTWSQVAAKKKELEDDAPMKELRRQRDLKLAETDYYSLSDVTMSDDMKTYRQSLRDITKTAKPTLTNDGSQYGVLGNVTWPTKPS